MFTKIREMYYRNRMRAAKRRGLFEVERDIEYLMAFKGDMIRFDESKARKRMAELKKIDQRSPVEEAELDAILGVISESKVVKNEYEKSKFLAEDLKKYISFL